MATVDPQRVYDRMDSEFEPLICLETEMAVEELCTSRSVPFDVDIYYIILQLVVTVHTG